MNEEPEATGEEELVEVPRPKTGAEAWKERRALIIERGAAARDRSKGANVNGNRTTNRVADERRLNTDRTATQLRAKNTGRTQKRDRG